MKSLEGCEGQAAAAVAGSAASRSAQVIKDGFEAGSDAAHCLCHGSSEALVLLTRAGKECQRLYRSPSTHYCFFLLISVKTKAGGR